VPSTFAYLLPFVSYEMTISLFFPNFPVNREELKGLKVSKNVLLMATLALWIRCYEQGILEFLLSLFLSRRELEKKGLHTFLKWGKNLLNLSRRLANFILLWFSGIQITYVLEKGLFVLSAICVLDTEHFDMNMHTLTIGYYTPKTCKMFTKIGKFLAT